MGYRASLDPNDAHSLIAPVGAAGLVTSMSDYLIIEDMTFLAGEALEEGDWVAIDSTGTNSVEVKKCGDHPTTPGAIAAIGCVMGTLSPTGAFETFADGAPVRVLMKGVHPLAKCDINAAEGDVLMKSTSAGRALGIGPGTATSPIAGAILGWALTAMDDIGTTDERCAAWVNCD